MKGRPMQEYFLTFTEYANSYDLLTVASHLCEGKSPIGKHLINVEE
jgi:hypothetical protein